MHICTIPYPYGALSTIWIGLHPLSIQNPTHMVDDLDDGWWII